jgi:NADH:ubiquinone oxidoreductase subunit H
MVGWIVVGVIFFCLVVVLSLLYWFERRKKNELQKRLKEIKGTDKYKLQKRAH